MLTMGRLVAAILWAVLGYVAGRLVLDGLPPELPAEDMPTVTAAIGFVIGWKFAGPFSIRAAGLRVNRAGAISFGLQTSFLLWISSLAFHAGAKMIDKALDKRYGSDVLLALTDIFALMWKFAGYTLRLDVIALLVLGGVIGGLIVEMISRRLQ